MNPKRLRIGFVPLCDATALIVAVDKGFAARRRARRRTGARSVDAMTLCSFFALHKISADAVAMGIAGLHWRFVNASGARDKQL